MALFTHFAFFSRFLAAFMFTFFASFNGCFATRFLVVRGAHCALTNEQSQRAENCA